jgi:hypothetical protein
MKLVVRKGSNGWRARLVWADDFAILVGDYQTWSMAMRVGGVAYRWNSVKPSKTVRF